MPSPPKSPANIRNVIIFPFSVKIVKSLSD
jgi:hypothetical protein